MRRTGRLLPELPPGSAAHTGYTLRSRLLLWILLPVCALLMFNTYSLYQQARRAADTAYDRTLLATAKAIGEMLEVTADKPVRLKSTVLFSALEAFEADNSSRLFYKVTGFEGETVSGFDDLPSSHRTIPALGLYAALVDFYDEDYRGMPVRMAVLLQPVAGLTGMGMATIHVAETLELRHTLARQILLDTVWRQAALLLLITAVVVLAVQRATCDVQVVSQQLLDRQADDLRPLDAGAAPRELQPLVGATNQMMVRLGGLLEHQKRFVRDASHQLRTPLAVLKTQVQSALRGDLPPLEALLEINTTVDRATQLANQMLSLAKVEQLRHQPETGLHDLGDLTRQIALDLAPLIVSKDLDFDISTTPAPVEAHEWALRELVRNLLHNAIKHDPVGAALQVRVQASDTEVELHIADAGPGLAPRAQERLFQPFAAGDHRSGSGLGLAICHEIVRTLHGRITLDNRSVDGQVVGLDARVHLPRAQRPLANSVSRPLAPPATRSTTPTLPHESKEPFT